MNLWQKLRVKRERNYKKRRKKRNRMVLREFVMKRKEETVTLT